MPIKIMRFAYNPEATFKAHESYLLQNDISVCAYVSFIDKYNEMYELRRPDIICYHTGTIQIHQYAHEFSCKLLAVSDHFSIDQQEEARELGSRKAENGLNIMGYVPLRSDFLVAAIRLIHAGQECFNSKGAWPDE